MMVARDEVLQSFDDICAFQKDWAQLNAKSQGLLTQLMNTKIQLTYTDSQNWGVLGSLSNARDKIERKVASVELCRLPCLAKHVQGS
jgi:hypothetical protein